MHFLATEMMLLLEAIQILSRTSLWNCCLLLVIRFFVSDRSPGHGWKSFFLWIKTESRVCCHVRSWQCSSECFPADHQ